MNNKAIKELGENEDVDEIGELEKIESSNLSKELEINKSS